MDRLLYFGASDSPDTTDPVLRFPQSSADLSILKLGFELTRDLGRTVLNPDNSGSTLSSGLLGGYEWNMVRVPQVFQRARRRSRVKLGVTTCKSRGLGLSESRVA